MMQSTHINSTLKVLKQLSLVENPFVLAEIIYIEVYYCIVSEAAKLISEAQPRTHNKDFEHPSTKERGTFSRCRILDQLRDDLAAHAVLDHAIGNGDGIETVAVRELIAAARVALEDVQNRDRNERKKYKRLGEVTLYQPGEGVP